MLYAKKYHTYNENKKENDVAKYRVIYSVLCAGVMFLLVQWYTEIYLAIMLFLILFPIVLQIWLRIEVRQIKLHIAISGYFEEGGITPIHVCADGKHMINLGRIRGSLKIRNLISGHEVNPSTELFTKGKRYEGMVSYENVRCGRIYVSLESPIACDCFGITTCRMKVAPESSFLVYPKINENDRNLSETEYDYGDDQYGIREYRDGDSLSEIHWKLSAKWDTLLVKQYGRDEMGEMSERSETCRKCRYQELCYIAVNR